MRSALIFISFFLACRLSSAQVTSLVPDYTWSAANLPQSREQINADWSGPLDAVVWWINLFAQNALQDKIRALIDDSIAESAKEMVWTGDGILVSIRLIHRADPQSGLDVVGILGNRAFRCGSGKSPEEAYFDYWNTPQLRPGVPAGWSEPAYGETLLWTTLDRNGVPHTTVVPKGVAADLADQVKQSFSVLALNAYRRSWSNTNTWLTIANSAKQRLNDQASKMAVDTAWNAVKISRDHVADLNTKLQEAISSQQLAWTALRTVRALQGIFTVAELAQQVVTIMGAPVPELSTATTSSAVIQYTQALYNNEYQAQAGASIAFQNSLSDLQKNLSDLNSLAIKAGAPSTITDSTTVKWSPLP